MWKKDNEINIIINRIVYIKKFKNVKFKLYCLFIKSKWLYLKSYTFYQQ